MDIKNFIMNFIKKFTDDESAIKRIPKYFFLIVVLLIVIAVELHQTNEKLDKILDNNVEEKKQMVVEIFSEEEKTPADYMPILDDVTNDESSTETTTDETTTKGNSSNSVSTETTTKSKPETTTKTANSTETQQSNNVGKTEYILNINSKKIHFPDCSSAARTKDENKKTVNLTADELKEYLNDGYEFCKICGGN